MPYSDLGPSPSFWRCPACGSEAQFHASGTGDIRCASCGRSSTAKQLETAHAEAHPSAPQ